MSGPNLPENVTAGSSGHSAHHNAVHDVVNRFDITDTPAVGEVPMWNGSLYTPTVPPGSSASAGFDSAFGHRYVDYVNGSDADNGNSPATAKKTLQAAHDSLPSNGGIVWAAGGIHQISSQVNWSRDNSMLIGAGRNNTRFQGMTNGIHMIKLTGDYVTMMDFKIGDQSETSGINCRTAIYLDGGEWPNLTRIRFDQLAKGQGAGADWDTGGAQVRAWGVQKFGDWCFINHCEFRSGYRGFVAADAMNGWMQNCSFYGNTMERVYILKRGGGSFGQSVSWRFNQCQWVGSPGSNYQVRVDKTASALSSGTIQFVNCMTEMSGAGSGFGSYYINLSDVQFVDCVFGVTDATGPTIRVGPTGQVVCGQYTSDGTPVFQKESGGSFVLWQSSDYSGSVTSV